MDIEEVREKTSRSNEKLDLARKLAKDAEKLDEGSEQRKMMEERIQKLIEEARTLTDTAKQEVNKYR